MKKRDKIIDEWRGIQGFTYERREPLITSTDEYGHIFILSGTPTEEEWVNLKKKARRHAKECKAARDRTDKAYMEYLSASAKYNEAGLLNVIIVGLVA